MLQDDDLHKSQYRAVAVGSPAWVEKGASRIYAILTDNERLFSIGAPDRLLCTCATVQA